jgi:hypothetical protein
MAAHANTLTHSAPQVSANGAYFSRTYRQYCSLLNAIANLPADAPDEAVDEAQSRADELLDSILSARAGTPEHLAIKLKVLAQNEKDNIHASGGDADTFGRFAMLAADLDCIMSAGQSSETTEQPIASDFAGKLKAFTGYDDAVKALPGAATDAEIELADNNQFDAFCDLMHAAPQTAAEAAAQLRAILSDAERDNCLMKGSPNGDAIAAGLANVLAAIERLAGKAVRS